MFWVSLWWLRSDTKTPQNTGVCHATQAHDTDRSIPVDHPLGGELEPISDWLDAHPEMLDAVAANLGAQNARSCCGLSCQTVLRCAVLKHLRGETWRGLAFALWDSLSASRFARVDPLAPPKKSTLPHAIGAVSAETRERINRCLLEAVREAGVVWPAPKLRITLKMLQSRAGARGNRPPETQPSRIERNWWRNNRLNSAVYGLELTRKMIPLPEIS